MASFIIYMDCIGSVSLNSYVLWQKRISMILLNQQEAAMATKQMGYKIGRPRLYMKQMQILTNIYANFSPASIYGPVYSCSRSLYLSYLVFGRSSSSSNSFFFLSFREHLLSRHLFKSLTDIAPSSLAFVLKMEMHMARHRPVPATIYQRTSKFLQGSVYICTTPTHINSYRKIILKIELFMIVFVYLPSYFAIKINMKVETTLIT